MVFIELVNNHKNKQHEPGDDFTFYAIIETHIIICNIFVLKRNHTNDFISISNGQA